MILGRVNISLTSLQCSKIGHIARNCPEAGGYGGQGGGYGGQQGGYGGGGFGGGRGQGGQTCYSCGGYGHMSRKLFISLTQTFLTNQVTALKAKSATTVVRLVISPETAHPRPPTSVLATSASNPATFRLNARTKSSLRKQYNEGPRHFSQRHERERMILHFREKHHACNGYD